MGKESIQTFLLTHPYKKVVSLRHICTACKLSSIGVAETLRNRILEHVGEDEDMEAKVRDTAIKFKQDSYKTPPFPISPIVLELKGSSPIVRRRINTPPGDDGPQVTDETLDLFGSQTQEDSPEIDSNNPNSKSILDEIDEVEAMADEIEKSFRQSDENGDDDDDEESTDETVEAPVEDANAKALRLIKQVEFLHDRQMEIVANKDKHIETIESALATAVSATSQLMEKYDRETTAMRDKLRELQEGVKSTLDSAISELRQNATDLNASVKDSNKKLIKLSLI